MFSNNIKVMTQCMGNAASTSAGIFLLGEVRVMSETSFLMVHKIAIVASATRMTEVHHNSSATYAKLASKIMDTLLAPFFSKDDDALRRYNDGQDVYLDFDTCCRLGICTHVLGDYDDIIGVSEYMRKDDAEA